MYAYTYIYIYVYTHVTLKRHPSNPQSAQPFWPTPGSSQRPLPTFLCRRAVGWGWGRRLGMGKRATYVKGISKAAASEDRRMPISAIILLLLMIIILMIIMMIMLLLLLLLLMIIIIIITT